jgi:hypothetical protein
MAMTKTPTINPDGVSIKGCDFIYAPELQAGEYSPLAGNPYRGCGHGCSYCYVPGVLRMDRKEFDAGAVSRPDYLAHLRVIVPNVLPGTKVGSISSASCANVRPFWAPSSLRQVSACSDYMASEQEVITVPPTFFGNTIKGKTVF